MKRESSITPGSLQSGGEGGGVISASAAPNYGGVRADFEVPVPGARKPETVYNTHT